MEATDDCDFTTTTTTRYRDSAATIEMPSHRSVLSVAVVGTPHWAEHLVDYRLGRWLLRRLRFPFGYVAE